MVVRGSCINERMPSCMRAPPEAAKRIKGQPFSTAVSSPLITASPAAMPSEPPMKSQSCTAITAPVKLAEAKLHRVVQAGLAARVLEAVGIAAFVAEFQRTNRHLRNRDIE